MAVMTEAYITGTGSFLPGEPVGNAELAARFGDGTSRDTVVRDRVLAANEIRTRHYAEPGMLNEELAARAVQRALQDRGLQTKQVGMLATGTTQGDLRVPGFASMVHGRLGGGPCELLSAGGVCASGMAALKAAVSAVRLGEHPVAVATGSELASRWLLAGPATTADTSFLRWTLSDGAGAVVVEPEPRPDGLSLRVDWMHLVSHAHDHPVCMSAGPETSLRQDMSMLPELVDLGVAEFCALVKAGRIDPDTEHILCHYSAGHFRHKLLARLREEGYDPADKQLFSNLETVGNIGAASIFVMLDEVRPALAPGDRVLLVVPESGRFSLAFAQLTCVGPGRHPSPRHRRFSTLTWRRYGRNWNDPWPAYRSSAASRTVPRHSRTTGGCCSTSASRSSTVAGGSPWPRRTSPRTCSGCAAPRSSTPRPSTATSCCWNATTRASAATTRQSSRPHRTSGRPHCLPSSSTGPASLTRSTSSVPCSSSRASAWSRLPAGRTSSSAR
jgi:3-oxoacyl-[acyl-carrier-protein] synthase III